jgi:hypothetical protein
MGYCINGDPHSIVDSFKIKRKYIMEKSNALQFHTTIQKIERKNQKEQDINPKAILKTLQQVKTQLEQMKIARPYLRQQPKS